MTALQSDRRVRGFTLLELVVSAVLTALLMAGLLSILRSTLQTNQQSGAVLANETSVQWLREQIEWDLQNTRGILTRPNEVVLYGFLGRDAAGLPDYRPSYVGYRIRSAGIFRWQGTIHNAKTHPTESLLWAGAAGMSVVVDELADEGGAQETAETGGLPMAPRSINFELYSASGVSITRLPVSISEQP